MARKSRPPRSSALDLHFGGRVADRRRQLGRTAAEMDNAIEARPGTVAGIEGGARRVGAGQLLALGRALDVPVSYFFEASAPEPSGGSPGSPEAGQIAEDERFVAVYFKISDTGVRRDILARSKAAGVRERA